MLKIYWSIQYTRAGETYDVEPLNPSQVADLISGLKPDDRGRGWRSWNIPGAFVHACAVLEIYPDAPTSNVLDDYQTLCSRQSDRPGMDALTGLMRQTVADQYRVFKDAHVTDPKQAGEWLGVMMADMYGHYDAYHMMAAANR